MNPGDFGPYDFHAPLYIVSVVLHDQSVDISDLIQSHEEHVSRLGYPNNHIIVYYDNGQTELTYKLFQVADLICTLELLNEKAASNSLTRSETEFLHSPREFHKEYYRKIVKKHI